MQRIKSRKLLIYLFRKSIFKGYLFINDDGFAKFLELDNLKNFNIPLLYHFHNPTSILS